MKFRRHDDLLRVVHIAGPIHNILGLKLQTDQVDATIEELVASGIPNLSANEVVREVYEGINDANRELGADYKPARIQFALSDTGPASVYRTLAHEAARNYARYMGPRLTTQHEERLGVADRSRANSLRTSQG